MFLRKIFVIAILSALFLSASGRAANITGGRNPENGGDAYRSQQDFETHYPFTPGAIITIDGNANGQLWVEGGVEIQHNIVASGPGPNENPGFGPLRLDNSTLLGSFTFTGDTSIGVHGTLGTLKGDLLTGGLESTPYTISVVRTGIIKIEPTSGDNSTFNGQWNLVSGYLETTNTNISAAANGGDQVLGQNAIFFNGGTLLARDTNVTRTLHSNIVVQPNGGRFQTETHLTLYGNITGSGTLTKNAGYNLVINSADNSGFSGNWRLESGWVIPNQNNAFGTGNITLAGGGIQAASGDATIGNDIIVENVGHLYTAAGNLYLSGTISGTGTLNVRGGNTVIAYGANKMTSGVINITEKNYYLHSDDAAAGNEKIAWNISGAGASLRTRGMTQDVTVKLGALMGSGMLSREADSWTTTYEVGHMGISTDFAGSIREVDGAGSTHGKTALRKVGGGTLTLSSATNDYSGGTVVDGGAIRLSDAGTLGTGDVKFNAGTELQLARTSITNIDGKYTFDNAASIKAISGVVSLQKTGLTLKNLHAEAGSTVTTTDAINVTGEYGQGTRRFTQTGGNGMSIAATASNNLAAAADITLNGGTVKLSEPLSGAHLPVATGLALRLDASSADNFSFNGDGSIATWYDTSGNHNNGQLSVRNSSAQRPTLQGNAERGNTVVQFPTDGNSGFDFTTSATLSQFQNTIQTVFWVLNDNPARESFVLGATDDSYHFHRGEPNSDGVRYLWEGPHNYTSERIRTGTTMLNGEKIDGTQTTLSYEMVDGTAVGKWDLLSVQTKGGGVTATSLSHDRGQTDNRSWDGSMGEVLIFTEALTDAQVAEVNRYLNTKWNLGLGLAEFKIDTFNAAGTTLTLANDTALDISAFSNVVFDNINVAGNALTLMQNATGTTLRSNIVMGSGGQISLLGDDKQVIVGDVFVTGDKLATTTWDGGFEVQGKLVFDMSNIDLTDLATPLLHVTGDMDFARTTIEFMNLGDVELPASGLTLMQIDGKILNLMLGDFMMPEDISWTISFDKAGGAIILLGSDVPEPATWLMLLAGTAGLAVLRRNKK